MLQTGERWNTQSRLKQSVNKSCKFRTLVMDGAAFSEERAESIFRGSRFQPASIWAEQVTQTGRPTGMCSERLVNVKTQGPDTDWRSFISYSPKHVQRGSKSASTGEVTRLHVVFLSRHKLVIFSPAVCGRKSTADADLLAFMVIPLSIFATFVV